VPEELEEVVSARDEMADMLVVLERELLAGLKAGRSVKKMGAKTRLNFADKTYVIAVTWDHSELSTERLTASIDAMLGFPLVHPNTQKLVKMAKLAIRLRGCLASAKWDELRQVFADAQTDKAVSGMDELRMAEQEFLCFELERVTKTKDQKMLKEALAKATAVGMLPSEKPVYKALQVFVDPPEYLSQPSGDVWPDARGYVVLVVNVRSADTIQWVKNGIALKEGADGGRISGTETNTLIISKLLGRDKNQKVWAVAKNKWGTVQSSTVTLKLPTEGEPAPPPLPKSESSALVLHDDGEGSDLSELVHAPSREAAQTRARGNTFSKVFNWKNSPKKPEEGESPSRKSTRKSERTSSAEGSAGRTISFFGKKAPRESAVIDEGEGEGEEGRTARTASSEDIAANQVVSGDL